MNARPTRREFLHDAVACGAVAILPGPSLSSGSDAPLQEFRYDQVRVNGERQKEQADNVRSMLMSLAEDSLMKPFREMAGKPAAGTSLGGWYEWNPTYDFHHDDAGLAPASTFGQWMSALARLHAASRFGDAAGDDALAQRVERLHTLLAQEISPAYFRKTRFAGYSYDKLVCGLVDAHRCLGDPTAFRTLDQVTAAARSVLPGQAIDREIQWKLGADQSWLWDENYTLPENLFLASTLGAGAAYRAMAHAYLLNETFFEPLSRGVDLMADRHAYSYVNALCSAMQAYFVEGSRMHLDAARNGFALLERQSFATGGWGPDELLRKAGYDQVAGSLTTSHNSFETPCGGYAHMKLTRYLLRATRDGHYGDSMERVFVNTVAGALPLQPDGRSFYYSDYNFAAKRIYSLHRWPCCSGTLPQVVADFGINTYLFEPGAIWINLYQPSELRCKPGPVDVTLEQTGSYLDDGKVRCTIHPTRPVAFALRLRVPAWSGTGTTLCVNAQPHPIAFALRLRIPSWSGTDTTLRVNAQPYPIAVRNGFATIERLWRAGDTVDLQFAMALRLECLPADGAKPHSDTVALLWGPRVLFALREPSDTGPLSFKENSLLNASRIAPNEWRAESTGGQRILVPFTDIGDREYSTYLKLT